MTKLSPIILGILLLGLMIGASSFRSGIPEWVNISERWAEIRYNRPSDKQIQALQILSRDTEALVMAHPGQAEALVWNAVVLSTLGRLQGGSEGLGLARQAMKLLDQAEKIQPEVLDGLVYTLKGSLYFKVPGWPIGFGDPGLAKTYLEKALTIDPHNIDANYFYAEYLLHERDFNGAIAAYKKVLAAKPRPGQTLADDGRKREARAAIVRAEALRQQQRADIKRVLQ
ncbi:MAG: tetratricopeptide repeat protein [Candidatus Thiodiazotropha sp.]